MTLFLSLHVKFIWSKVVLMHDIASRHLWEWLLSILLSLVHFYFESLKISEIFQRKKMMKRLLRGSSSRSSKDKKSEENKKPKYNLPRTVEVRPCEWPCDESCEPPEFMMIFITRLRMQASPTSSTTSSNSISYSLIFLCKIFISMLGDHHLR